MLSSPRPREGIWKQPVPQKAISSCLEFFMNPAVCVFNLRNLIKKTSKSQVLRKLLRQFDKASKASVPDLVSNCDSKSVVCSCARVNDSVKQEDTDCVDSRVINSADIVTKSASSLSVDENPLSNLPKRKKKYVVNSKEGVSALCDRLRSTKESKLLESISKSNVNSCISDDSKVPCAKTQAILPKKRVFKEMDSKDLRPPKKKSPPSQKIVHDTRTILNVPGLNSEFYRRHSTQWGDSASSSGNGLFESQPVIPPTNFSPKEDIPKGLTNSPSRKTFKPSRTIPNHTKSRSESSSTSNHLNSVSSGAKSSSPTRGTSRKAMDYDYDSKFLNSQVTYPINSAMSLSSIPLQQQEKFLQQQTMSKAISYTINSLLSNPTPCENALGGSNKKSLLKPNLDAIHSYSEKKLNSVNGNRFSKSKSTPSSQQLKNDLPQGSCNLKSDNDQNSFLRHLLDTSDPIPTSTLEKCERSSNGAGSNDKGKQQASWSPNSRATSQPKKSNSNDSRPSSSGDDIRKNSSAPSKPVSHSNKTANNSKSNSSHHFAPYPSQFHPSLVNGGFPLSLGAYDAFLRGPQDPQSAALAAAAALQYRALLPQNILTNLNSQMAAAMAASYLGGTPNPSHSTMSALSSSRSPDHSHSSSPINYSSGSPLNLSQRTWPGPGHPNGLHSEPGVIPGQFLTSPGDNSRHSLRGSPLSATYGRSRAESLQEVDSGNNFNSVHLKGSKCHNYVLSNYYHSFLSRYSSKPQ